MEDGKFRNRLFWSLSPTAEDRLCPNTLRETGIRIKVNCEELAIAVVCTTIQAKMLMPVRSTHDSFDDTIKRRLNTIFYGPKDLDVILAHPNNCTALKH